MVSVAVAGEPSHGAAQLNFRITVEADQFDIWFRSSGEHRLEASGDLELAMALPVAMATDGVLELDLPVDAELLPAVNAIQDVLLSWYPELRRATIVAADESAPRLPPHRGTLACFTGGVDSFYTLETHRDELNGLLFIHGFDVPLDDGPLRASISEHLREAARDSGVALIELETNLRVLLDGYVDWGQIAHGPALVATAFALRSAFARFVIPSSHSFRDLFPWGSHPVLDPIWSTPSLKVEHDGAGATRVDKIKLIASSPAVRRHLRVCWQPGGNYNCGSCEKCIRTMITLQLIGELTASETFPHDIDLDVVAGLHLRNQNDASYLRENLDLARRVGSTAYETALEQAQRRFVVEER